MLVFGSHTCTVFRRDLPAVRGLVDEFGGRAAFAMVYVREAHASDEWTLPKNVADGIVFAQPVTDDARCYAAARFAAWASLGIPVLADGIDDGVMRAWGGWPDRLYVIDAAGRVAHQSGVGPFGFDPPAAAERLRKITGGGSGARP